MKIRVTYQEIVNNTAVVEVDDENDLLDAYLDAEEYESSSVLEREYISHEVLDPTNVVLPDVKAKPNAPDWED